MAHDQAWRCSAAFAFLTATITGAGCLDQKPPEPAPGADGRGAVALLLDGTGGLTLDTLTYVITGSASNPFSLSGSLDLTQSAAISATIGGIPAAPGYTVALSGDGGGAAVTCAGSAPFDVVAAATTAVTVHLICQEAPRTGSVIVNGSANICPTIDALTATPAQVDVGASLALSASAHDLDGGPSPLAYQWTATSGVLSAPTATSTSLMCNAAGPVTVKVTVSDGDPAVGCPAMRTATVVCRPAFHVVASATDLLPGDSASLTVVANDGAAHPIWTYTWTDGRTGAAAGVFTPSASGAPVVTYAPAACSALGNGDQTIYVAVTVTDATIGAITRVSTPLIVHCPSA
jgi:hypothetical protein